MLVLSRKPGECILIGDNIQVMVLEVSGDGVKLGVSAPRETPIFRLEVLAEIESENRKAQGLPPELALNSLRLSTKIQPANAKRLVLCGLAHEKKPAAKK